MARLCEPDSIVGAGHTGSRRFADIWQSSPVFEQLRDSAGFFVLAEVEYRGARAAEWVKRLRSPESRITAWKN